MIDRLLKRLHRVFNREPEAVSIVSVVTDRVNFTVALQGLVLKLSANEIDLSIDISALTIEELVSVVNAGSAGAFSAALLNPEYGKLLARGIVVSDTIQYPTNLLYQEFQVYGWTLSEAVKQRESAEKQLYANTAEAGWLDYWMSYFQVPRLRLESDQNFLRRAVAEIFSIKVNNKALMKLIADAVNYPVDVRDLGENPQNCLYSDNVRGLSDRTNIESIIIDTSVTVIRNGWIGVYLHNGNINNLNQRDRDAIINIINRYKASGKQVAYFAPVGYLIADDPTTFLDNIGFVSGPKTPSWLEVAI